MSERLVENVKAFDGSSMDVANWLKKVKVGGEIEEDWRFGVGNTTTWYLAKQKMPGVKPVDVVKVVDLCQQCI